MSYFKYFIFLLRLKNILKIFLYRKIAIIRKWKFIIKGYNISKSSYIGPRCSIGGPTFRLGDNSTLVSGVNFFGDITIGNNCIIAARCKILTRSHDYFCGDALPYGTNYIHKPVKIEDNVWIGNDVMIVPGVKIGEGAVIAMGSVVTKDVPECAVAGGNPAIILKFRDKERYQRLKKEKRYLNNIRGIKIKSWLKYKKIINKKLNKTKVIWEKELSEIPSKIRPAVLYRYSQENGKYKFILDEEGYKLSGK